MLFDTRKTMHLHAIARVRVCMYGALAHAPHSQIEREHVQAVKRLMLHKHAQNYKNFQQMVNLTRYSGDYTCIHTIFRQDLSNDDDIN